MACKRIRYELTDVIFLLIEQSFVVVTGGQRRSLIPRYFALALTWFSLSKKEGERVNGFPLTST